MPHLEFWCDERYPDYGYSVQEKRTIHTKTVTKEKLDEWEKVSELYSKMQDELKAMYDK